MFEVEWLVEQAVGICLFKGINYYGLGMVMFFGFFMIGFIACSYFVDWCEGMFDWVVVVFVSSFVVVVGKVFLVFVLMLFSLVVMGVVIIVFFGVDWGLLVVVVVVCVVMVLAVIALVIFVIAVVCIEC